MPRMPHGCLADPVIRTARLVLRMPLPGDLAWQAEFLNTPAVMRHLGGVRDGAALAASFADNVAALERGDPGFWTVVRSADAVVIGKCGLCGIETAAAPAQLAGARQIGWSLGEPWWGMGYAAEAARAVIGHFFTYSAAADLWSQTSDSNGASTRMMARLGFQRMAALDYVDPDYPPADNPTTVYRIGREAWAGVK